MLSRLALLTVLATLAIAGAAQAKTFCVADTSCADPRTTIADALKSASDNPGPDDVKIGPGTFDESVAYAGNGPLTIVGAGRDRTKILSAPKKEWVVDLERTTISDLTVRAAEVNDVSTGGLRLFSSTARRVHVEQEGDREAVQLENGAFFEDSSVKAEQLFATGIYSTCQTGCSVRRSRLDASIALVSEGLARTSAEEIETVGAVGAIDGGEIVLERSVIAPDAGFPIGMLIFGGVIDARQTTVAPRGPSLDSDTYGAVVGASIIGKLRADKPSVLRLDSTVIDGFRTPITRATEFEARALREVIPASVIARDSAWDLSRDLLTRAKPGLDLQRVVDLAGRSGGFRNPTGGDFHLRADSPLIDAVAGGAPAGFRDFDGNAAADGDSDGSVRPDIGAFEAPAGTRSAPTPPASPAAPAPAPAAQPGQPTLRAVVDAIAPRLSGVRLANGRLLVRLSEPARLRITISRRVRRSFKRVRTLTVAAKKGDNRIRLARPKRKGAYRVEVVAVDAVGNRSAAKRVALRVR